MIAGVVVRVVVMVIEQLMLVMVTMLKIVLSFR